MYIIKKNPFQPKSMFLILKLVKFRGTLNIKMCIYGNGLPPMIVETCYSRLSHHSLGVPVRIKCQPEGGVTVTQSVSGLHIHQVAHFFLVTE